MSDDKLRLSGFSHESFVDGPGIRTVVFVQGCKQACPHCHNPESWDMTGGEEYTVRQVIKKIKGDSLAFPHAKKKKAPREKQVQGVTFSGGEPFLQAAALVKVAHAAKRMGLDITVYSGYTYEELCKNPDENVQALLSLADYLIDGPYIHEQRDIGLKFRGSANQRVIDLNKTRRAGEAVLFAG